MRDGFRIYDTHTHLGQARHSNGRCDADTMLRRMDAAGIDRALLIPFPVVEDYRATHDEIGRATKDHPDRFAGAACLNPYVPPQEFEGELARCAEFYGFRVWKLQPQYQAINPLTRRHDHLYEAAIQNKMALVCHTGIGVPFALPSLWIAPAQRFPELSIVLGHAGGGLFFAESIIAAQVCANISIEVSSLLPHQVHEILAHIPASRVMCGSDLPDNLEMEIGKVLHLDIPPADKQDILWNTGRRVLDGVTS